VKYVGNDQSDEQKCSVANGDNIMTSLSTQLMETLRSQLVESELVNSNESANHKPTPKCYLGRRLSKGTHEYVHQYFETTFSRCDSLRSMNTPI